MKIQNHSQILQIRNKFSIFLNLILQIWNPTKNSSIQMQPNLLLFINLSSSQINFNLSFHLFKLPTFYSFSPICSRLNNYYALCLSKLQHLLHFEMQLSSNFCNFYNNKIKKEKVNKQKERSPTGLQRSSTE